MSTDERMKLAEEVRERTAMRYAGDCKCRACQLVPREMLDRILAALRAPEAADAGAMAWQPMDGAPRDRKIELQFGDDILQGYWGKVAWLRIAGVWEHGWRTPKRNLRANEPQGWREIASPTAAGIAAPPVKAGLSLSLIGAIVAAMSQRARSYGHDEAWEDLRVVQKWADDCCKPPAASADAVRDETRHVTDEDREYASELLADLNSGDLPRLEIAARWFRKARVERALTAPVAGPPRMSVHDYVDGYEYRGDQDHTPTEDERAMLEDAIEGYLSFAENTAPVAGADAGMRVAQSLPQNLSAATNLPNGTDARTTECAALTKAEESFEAIRLVLWGQFEEPVRQAFWKAVEARDAIRALSAQRSAK